MEFPKQTMLDAAKAFGFLLTPLQIKHFDRYAQLLLEWNQKINLTAITQPDEIAIKHFLDSLLLLSALKIPQKAKLIDVGTGAGFPALPCALVRPDLQVTLLDSLNKRILFLNEVCAELSFHTVQTIHARAEEGARMLALREHFDVATARAVANMRELAEYCLPYVKVGGVFAALKGFEIENELQEAKPAIELLGGRIQEVKKYILPDDSRRSIVLIEKITRTPTKYPRQSAKIAKSPL